MYEYLQFFGYNLLAFIVALIIWKFIPKPTPEDYSTIPGFKLTHKSDQQGIDEENLANIWEHDSFADFLKFLHSSFGPLASFYWRDTYVVSIGNVAMAQQLWRNDADATPQATAAQNAASLFEALSSKSKSFTPLLKESFSHHATEMLESSQKLRSVAKPENSEKADLQKRQSNVAAEFLLFLALAELEPAVSSNMLLTDADLLQTALRQADAEIDHQIRNRPGKDKEIPKSLSKSAHVCSTLLKAVNLNESSRCYDLLPSLSLLDRALCSLLKYRQEMPPELRRELANAGSNGAANEPATSVNEPPPNLSSRLESFILEVIRMSVPVRIKLVRVPREIDVYGHPVPAQTPILLANDLLLFDAASWRNPHDFEPSRFVDREDSAGLLATCIFPWNSTNSDVARMALRTLTLILVTLLKLKFGADELFDDSEMSPLIPS